MIVPNNATNVLFNRGYLPVKGPSIDVDTARSIILRIAERRPNFIDSLHGAQLVHGSNSASLLSFTQYGAFRGDLLPIGIMEEQGRIPFSGEISFGRHGINQESLSTCWVGSILNAKRYAFAGDPWSFEGAKDSIERLKQEPLDSEHQDSPNSKGIKNMIEVNMKRISDWGKLDAQEKKLVSEPFPIMYGIHPSRQNTLHFARSDIDGEIGLKGGATSNEITVIFVPNEKIKEVQENLEKSGNGHIKVVDMSYAFQFSNKKS